MPRHPWHAYYFGIHYIGSQMNVSSACLNPSWKCSTACSFAENTNWLMANEWFIFSSHKIADVMKRWHWLHWRVRGPAIIISLQWRQSAGKQRSVVQSQQQILVLLNYLRVTQASFFYTVKKEDKVHLTRTNSKLLFVSESDSTFFKVEANFCREMLQKNNQSSVVPLKGIKWRAKGRIIGLFFF